jgi:hypothetical protein
MAASAIAGIGVAGAPSIDTSKRFAVKRLTFGGDFDGANIAGVQLALDADGVTEFYEVMVSSDCAGKQAAVPYRLAVSCNGTRSTPKRGLIMVRNVLAATQAPNMRLSSRCGTNSRSAEARPDSASEL